MSDHGEGRTKHSAGGDGVQRQQQQKYQEKLQSLAVEYKKVCEALARKEYEERVSQLSIRELSLLPDTESTKVYKALGRAFLLSSMEQVKGRLETVSQMAVAEAEKLQERKRQLETTLRSL